MGSVEWVRHWNGTLKSCKPWPKGWYFAFSVLSGRDGTGRGWGSSREDPFFHRRRAFVYGRSRRMRWGWKYPWITFWKLFFLTAFNRGKVEKHFAFFGVLCLKKSKSISQTASGSLEIFRWVCTHLTFTCSRYFGWKCVWCCLGTGFVEKKSNEILTALM